MQWEWMQKMNLADHFSIAETFERSDEIESSLKWPTTTNRLNVAFETATAFLDNLVFFCSSTSKTLICNRDVTVLNMHRK